jgi:hypothetical protein
MLNNSEAVGPLGWLVRLATAALVALFGISMWIGAHSPSAPDASLGKVFPITDDGRTVYVTALERWPMSATPVLFLVVFGLLVLQDILPAWRPNRNRA